MTDKALTSKIYKKLIQLNIKKKTKNLDMKMSRRPEQTFFQRRHRWLIST